MTSAVDRPIWPSMNRQVAAARAQIGAGAFDAAWAEGRTMTLAEAIADALNAMS